MVDLLKLLGTMVIDLKAELANTQQKLNFSEGLIRDLTLRLESAAIELKHSEENSRRISNKLKSANAELDKKEDVEPAKPVKPIEAAMKRAARHPSGKFKGGKDE